MTNAALKRVVRRETHSPRTAATVVVLVLIVAAAVYAGVEIALHLLGLAPLAVSPGAALAWVSALPAIRPAGIVIAAGAAVAVLGVVLVWLALSPGRRSKHRLGRGVRSVVVDNAVIASAVAERVRRELDLPADGIVVGIGHRGADVTVRPRPGQSVDAARVRSVAEAELAGYDLSPAVRTRARVQRRADEGDAA